MDQDVLLLLLYIIHRIFLFLDEWMFYFTLMYLYFKKVDYKIFLIVLIYGIACIFTSYSNIDRIEESFSHIHQKIWLFDFLRL